MSDKKADATAMEAAKAVMKRMLATPPAPQETKGNGKRKRKKKRAAD